MVSLATLTACNSAAEPADGGTVIPSEAPSSATATDPANAAQALLDRAGDADAALGGGFGLLETNFANTLAETPKGVRTVSFAFVCTGGSVATLRVSAMTETLIAVDPQVFPCDSVVRRTSVEMLKPGPANFTATVADPLNGGGFAFGWFPQVQES